MNIAVWYHCKLSGKGIPNPDFAVNVMCRQMHALKESGLAASASEIHIGVNGDDGDGLTAISLAPEKSILHVHGLGGISELPTLAVLRRWLPTHPGWAVLYHHTKGVTQPNDNFHQIHRQTMEGFLVRKWQQCVADLERGYDVVGINLVDPITRPVLPGRFFAGNFWWARSDYLSTLTPIPDNCSDFNDTAQRCLAEGWVGNHCLSRPKTIDYERPELTWWQP